jgi:peptidoglycan hydrolase-like protein with peptidoglycan-binding domain
MRRTTLLLATAVSALLAAAPAGAITNPQIPGLQVALRAHGYYTGAIDGIAGPMTAGAVRSFQRKRGLHADGLAGARTRAALGRLGRPLFGKRMLVRGRIGWDVSVLQFLLARRGFAPPHLNGNFGRGTERALRRFQRAYGLAADGIAGPRTRRALLTGKRAHHRATRRTSGLGSAASVAFYAVRPGDTLTSIASRFGTTVPALRRANRAARGRFLLADSRLRIPPASVVVHRPAAVLRSSVRSSIDRWAAHYGVDLHLARGLAWMESGFQNHVTSSVGAWGVMQVTPATWDFVETVLVGMPIARTADGNVRVGVAYLGHLLHEFKGDERLALAGYYQGPASVRKRGLLRESKAFVADVLALKARM